MFIKIAITEIDRPDSPSKQITQKVFQDLLKRQGWTFIKKKKKQRSITWITKTQEKYSFTIFYLSQSNSKNRIKHSTTIVHLKTQSNLYKVNSSRHYKCKGLFTEEFQQYFRIAESSDSQGEDRISESLQQQLETSEQFRTISHFLLNTIGNNKRKNSLKGSCHLRPS